MAITCNQMVLLVIFELCKLVQTCAVGKRSTIFGCQCKRYYVVCLLSFGLALPQLMNVHSVTQFVHRIFLVGATKCTKKLVIAGERPTYGRVMITFSLIPIH